MNQAGLLQLQWRPFGFALPQPLFTAAGTVQQRRGWLLRLQSPAGDVGWGEAAPLAGQLEPLAAALAALDASYGAAELERLLQAGQLPPTLAFALGAALAELAGLPQRRWLPPPAAAVLLPPGPAAIEVLEQLAPELGPAPVFKWKLAVCADGLERELLEQLLQRLPATARLRLDANGGWSRATAGAWAGRLAGEPRLQWLEQPLAPVDQAGLEALAAQVPVALDESLQCDPGLRSSWPGWQVRRPSQEGDPRVLLAALERGRPRLMLSTAFETGIGRRWLEHLAALQAEGPTPAAPGLAPGWQAPGALASADPAVVWAAAGQQPRRPSSCKSSGMPAAWRPWRARPPATSRLWRRRSGPMALALWKSVGGRGWCWAAAAARAVAAGACSPWPTCRLRRRPLAAGWRGWGWIRRAACSSTPCLCIT